MKLLTVALDDLNFEDERFRISPYFDLTSLVSSIKKIGLISPILIVKRADPRYVVLSGWKRICACRKIPLDRIPAFLVEEEEDSRAFLYSLFENWVVRKFDILEKAEILHKLIGFVKDEKKIVRDFFPLLDIPAILSYLDLFLKIARLESIWKEFIWEKKLPLSSAEILAEFTPDDRRCLLPLMRPLNKNKLKNFMENLHELSIKTGDSPEAILSTQEVQSVLLADNLSSLQKSEKILSSIQEKRYPRQSTWRNSFATSLKKARLSKDVVYDSASLFEDGEFAVNFSLLDRKSFQEKLAKLEKLGADEKFFSLFRDFEDE